MNENSIMVIHPYLHKGTWVFDDEEKNLQREPFIAGSDAMISMIVVSENLDVDGFSVCFSASFMPGSHFTLDWVRKEGGGNWYNCPELGLNELGKWEIKKWQNWAKLNRGNTTI